MISSEKSATFRDHAMGVAEARDAAAHRRIPMRVLRRHHPSGVQIT
jgi:hypothetical protein